MPYVVIECPTCDGTNTLSDPQAHHCGNCEGLGRLWIDERGVRPCGLAPDQAVVETREGHPTHDEDGNPVEV